ncbi:retrovirus-related Pol polyprotein from transposon 412 [Nephila pilipes]|uniref:Retrovirus-related Pol polyprotein from transposon 412 n=1 Tax=Nephila pilipes TaxID=299642 RepID=A0A8X6TNN5_NEPPI|nr:retrovirus-related Pol polyprotein from transposon 412 [Nephila pilipes]
METVLRGLSYEVCLVYLDDIIIVGRTFEDHLRSRVLEKLKIAILKLNPSKCNLFRREVGYLGHIISAEGVRTDPPIAKFSWTMHVSQEICQGFFKYFQTPSQVDRS